MTKVAPDYAVKAWNKKHKIGTPVRVTLGRGRTAQQIFSETTSEAFLVLLPSTRGAIDAAVVRVSDLPSFVRLDAVKAR